MKRILPPTLLLLCLVLMVVSHWVFPIQTIFPIPFNLLGILPLVLGVFINISADRQFAQVGTNVKTFNEPQKLVTDGWFRYSRNPMYLGFELTLAGVWILLGSASPILEVLIFAAITDRGYIPYEEQRMTAKFSQAYEDYKRQVRRWI
jgi:protein-S-isoprenylcysteine O-methyltransferase Ste14